jgi:tripartite ATP-independent transporter DctM subunit
MGYEWLAMSAAFGYFIIFLILGQSVATVLLGVGVVGLVFWSGPAMIIPFLESDVFYRVATYSFITIPLYVLMAFFLFRGGVIKDVYYVIHRFTGNRRSPLGFSTIIMGGLLGAVSGSATAISGGLAVLASPELMRYGYKKYYAISLAAVGGSLSALVPPSIIIIIYASIAELSIGKMFMGAVIPGILLVLIFGFIIVLHELIWPKGIVATMSESANELIEKNFSGSQAQEDFSFRKSAVSFIIILALVVIVFGGIYGGIMTATEAGGVAAMVALIAMLIRGKLTLKSTFQAHIDAARFSAMIMAIVIGAQIFGRFMAMSMIPRKLIGLMEPLMGQPQLILVLLLIIFFILGMILESAAVMVMVIPITDPIIRVIGVDPIWFGVVASFVIMLGLITPPVGLAVYAASTAAAVPVGGVFRHTMLFAVIAALVLTPLFFIFPELITWLPGLI